jgi:2-polyprenyl-3-methyl-5-hydroxy-6-metoxy-1,4-benzoquinol methylase
MSDTQPQRSKRVRETRRFDKTQLKAAGHGRTVNRDYAAHFFRWGWAARQIKQGESILDVGCGQDQPLLYVLASRKQTVPDVYVGVDLNRLVKKSACRWADIYDEFDFVNNGRWLLDNPNGYTPFDKAVCFEVIEHMDVEDGRKLLGQLHYCLRPQGLMYLSTPVFDGYRAANHIHEYTIPELQSLIEESGFTVKRRIGTFASKPEIRPSLDEHERSVYERLEEWFGGDVLSTIFASLHPDQSRNNLWVCERKSDEG